VLTVSFSIFLIKEQRRQMLFWAAMLLLYHMIGNWSRSRQLEAWKKEDC